MLELAILIGVVLFLESCLHVVPAEHRKIHPKAVWLMELPWALALMQLPGFAFFSNILIHAFISLAMLFSFESYFAARNVKVSLFMPFCGALGVAVAQILLMGVAMLRILWPDRPRWVVDLDKPLAWVMLLLVMYVFFIYSMFRLKEEVLKIEREKKKIQRAEEARQGLRRSSGTGKGKARNPAKEEADGAAGEQSA